MTMTSVNKITFTSINDKRYYGSDGIVSLPFGHRLLNKVIEYKKSRKFIMQSRKRKIKFLNLKMMRSVKAKG